MWQSFFVVWGCPMHSSGFPWRFMISWDKRNFLIIFCQSVWNSQQWLPSILFHRTFNSLFIKFLFGKSCWKNWMQCCKLCLIQLIWKVMLTSSLGYLNNFPNLGKYRHLCKLFPLKFGLLDSCFCLGQSDSSTVQDKVRNWVWVLQGELIPPLGRFPRKPAHWTVITWWAVKWPQ